MIDATGPGDGTNMGNVRFLGPPWQQQHVTPLPWPQTATQNWPQHWKCGACSSAIEEVGLAETLDSVQGTTAVRVAKSRRALVCPTCGLLAWVKS